MSSSSPDSSAQRFAVIGGGNMGEALLGGLLGRKWCAPSDVVVVEPFDARRSYLEETFGVRTQATVVPGLAPEVIIAVKPHFVESVCAALDANTQRVLSVAAGTTIANMERWLCHSGRVTPPAVIRSMPNTPALVGFGASAIAGGTAAGESDLLWAHEILSSVGVVEVVTETQIDAVTGLSGSGPAYVFLIAEALIEAGVLQGLARSVAATLAIQTIRGAGEMLANEPDRAATLRANVTSPGGTTAAGLQALESRAVRAAISEAVAAATSRSRQLGSPSA